MNWAGNVCLGCLLLVRLDGETSPSKGDQAEKTLMEQLDRMPGWADFSLRHSV